MSTNVMMRDLDIPGPHATMDGRRLEVIADGLPLFDGAQLALDTTMVFLLHRDGTAKRGTSVRGGAVLQEARRRKERTYPELNGAGGRARLVVLAAEVGGRSDETAQFLRALAKHRAQGAPGVMRQRVQSAWLRRWAICWHAMLRRLLHYRCWTGDLHLVLVVMRPRCMRWCAIVVWLEQKTFSVLSFAHLDLQLIS